MHFDLDIWSPHTIMPCPLVLGPVISLQGWILLLAYADTFSFVSVSQTRYFLRQLVVALLSLHPASMSACCPCFGNVKDAVVGGSLDMLKRSRNETPLLWMVAQLTRVAEPSIHVNRSSSRRGFIHV